MLRFLYKARLQSEAVVMAYTNRAPARSKRDISSERVLGVAAYLFREHGYDATSVRQIAEAADMKAGSLYYHYASKEMLLEAVMNRAISALTESVRTVLSQVDASAPFQQRIEAAIMAHLTALQKYGDYIIASRQSVAALPPKGRTEHQRLRREYSHLWRRLFEKAKDAGEIRDDIDVVAIEMFILGALNWTSEWLDPKKKPQTYLSAVLAQFVTSGLQPPTPARATRRTP
jgi:AcrR family transcriptional regulator